jgi:transketolase
MSLSNENLQLIADTVRALSMDAVEKANSGHPGMPMGCADIAAVLWTKIMRYNSSDPAWINRDRFVLSAGHGSMLLYSMLHLSGYDVSLDEIKNFRQMGSLTPGHPEFRHTPGVETTTGPLGQGFANGVGMAIAARLLGEEFNSSSGEIINHYIYGIAGDGCIMEGLSSEAASLAGHMGLGNIIYFYDSNNITIEGKTDLAFSEDVKKRFEAYNWHVLEIDGHNFEEIENAVIEAQKVKGRPSLIIASTIIAKGSVNFEGSEDAHGAPLGKDEIRITKDKLGFPSDRDFYVPEKVYELFRSVKEENLKEYDSWVNLFNSEITGEKKDKWDRFFSPCVIDDLRDEMTSFETGKSIATRSAGGTILAEIFEKLPGFVGGSADLGPSNKTTVKGIPVSGKGKVGRSIHFGVRENAMGSIQNGISYYGGFISFSATFLVFMDYMRPALRLAALSGLQSIYVFTHDSIFVGEDGPTHQPVEHLASARAIPNLNVIRPCDAEETREAWLAALENGTGPTLLALSRQNLPVLKRNDESKASNLFKGAYIVHDYEKPDCVIFASGSEVHISIEAAELLLEEKGIRARVVSFPCWEFFDRQDDDYRSSIMADDIPKIVVEAGIKMGWERYSGKDALFITVEGFGQSAPQKDLAEFYGFTPQKIRDRIVKYLS